MQFTAERYVDDVLNGRIQACRWVRLACERHRRDLARGHERGLWFDERAAQFAVAFFHLLPLWEGEKAGQPMALEPCQQFWVASLFGWKRSDGTRRFRTAYLEVARKNGKTPWAAGIGLLMAFFDKEPGAQVYSAATKRDQAMICHHHATQMVKRSSLSREIVSFRHNLHNVALASKFEPLSSDYNKLDGLNSHCVLADELHAWPSGELWGVLETSQSSRTQPLMLAITTAGVDLQSICWVQREYLMKVLLGQIEDDSFWGVIYTLDTKKDWPDLQTIAEHKENPDGGVAEDDWQDEAVWVKANPMLGVSKKRDAMRQAAKRAANQPSKLNGFLRWDLNVWTQATERWLSPVHWAKCGGALPDLRGRRCYAGMDLSSTQDITALVLVFPPLADDTRWWVLPRFWCPAEAIVERSKQDRVPYQAWERAGLLTATPGNVVDYGFVLAQLEEDLETYDLRELAYDRWGSQKVVTDLQEIGFEVDQKTADLYGRPLLVQFGQGFASMSGPMKEMEKLVAQGLLGHGDHAVLTWMADNVVKVSDPAGNIKPDKSKSREKIDGIVAAIMGLARAIVHGPEKGSVYEGRGLRTL